MMSYSDAGSAFILVRWSVPKWMFCLTVRVYLRLSRTPGDYFRYRAYQLAVLHWRNGAADSYSWQYFSESLNISKIESFVAVTTIFLGQNEIPAIVKPFIDRMNRNELFTAICSGMASIAGSMMIGYAGMGVPIDYLLAASLMAILGGILFARILSPATEPSQVTFENLSFSETPPKALLKLRRTVQ